MESLELENIENAFAHKTTKELKKAKFLFNLMDLPFFVSVGAKLMPLLLRGKLPFLKKWIKNNLYKQFVGGETLAETQPVCALLADYRIKVILDYGLEGKQNNSDFDSNTEAFMQVIEYAATQPNIPFVSLKITALAPVALLKNLNDAPRLRSGVHSNEQETDAWERLKDRLYVICETAHKNKVGILIDAEETWIQNAIDILVMEMMTLFNQQAAIVFNTIQLYRIDRLAFLNLSHQIARQKNFILGVKLVRGAYLEKERTAALLAGYASPIHATKRATDEDFDAGVKYCLDNIHSIFTIIAMHNESSTLTAVEYMQTRQLALDEKHIYFSQLFGMGDNISFNLAKLGCNVCKYLPFGPVEEVIPYLLRRAEENTAVKGQSNRELNLIKRELLRRSRTKIGNVISTV